MSRPAQAAVITFLLGCTLGIAQAQAAPPAGTYVCLTQTITTTNGIVYQPYSPNSNGTGYGIGLRPTAVVVGSPIGNFTLDGKGKYKHFLQNGQSFAGGTYTVDKAGKVKFAGSLADTSKVKFSGYRVGQNGPVFTFAIPSFPTECTLSTGKAGTTGAAANSTQTTQAAQPASTPKSAVPNPELSGVLTVSVHGQVYDIDARTGKVIWSSAGNGIQRLPGGLMAYALSDQLVIAKNKGEVLTRVNGLFWKQGTEGTEGFLSVSPDGTRVLVATLPVKDAFAAPNWRLLAANGQELARRSDDEASFYLSFPRDLPAFLPDGRLLIPDPEDKLLYVYDKNLKKQGLFVQEPSTSPVVSPDGKRVAMLRGSQIVLTDTSGRELQRLPVPDNVEVTTMVFSPDSRLLGLVLAVNSGFGRYLGLVNPANGKFEFLEDDDGKPFFINAGFDTHYRLSWWTGQSALPPAWKNGVPSPTTKP